MKTILALLPLMVACGSEVQVTTTSSPQSKPFYGSPSVDASSIELKLIVSEFYASADLLDKKVNKSLKSISFVDSMDEDVVGMCYFFVTSSGKEFYREIKLLRSFWMTATAQSKRVLVYHELGHCALSLEHAPERSPKIMAPVVLSDKVSAPSWYSLVTDMFADSPLKLVDSSLNHNDIVVNYLD